MKVVELNEFRGLDTIRVLKWLLSRAVRGELRGVALCFRDSEGAEGAAFTGSYKAHPGEGIDAALQLSISLNRAQGRLNGPP